MTTYLQAVNEVLARLREPSVVGVSSTTYSTMIGLYVNDAKRQVEDAWNWDVLSTTLTITTTPGTTNYVVAGSGRRQKDISANDVTSQVRLRNMPVQWIQDQQQLSQVQSGQPVYYAWNGSDGTDSKAELYPTPDSTYTIKFNLNIPQATLTANADIILVPAEPVIAGAFARALVERGEDGSLQSGEAYGLYKSVLADYIAIEKERYAEYETWVAV